MVTFKGKQYELKRLFIREEAKLAKQLGRLQDGDLEIKADAMIEVCRVMTGIDIGDLNGSTFAEIRDLQGALIDERAAARKAADSGAGDDGGGKAKGGAST